VAPPLTQFAERSAVRASALPKPLSKMVKEIGCRVSAAVASIFSVVPF
jgi:hypothetical protein